MGLGWAGWYMSSLVSFSIPAIGTALFVPFEILRIVDMKDEGLTC